MKEGRERTTTSLRSSTSLLHSVQFPLIIRRSEHQERNEGEVSGVRKRTNHHSPLNLIVGGSERAKTPTNKSVECGSFTLFLTPCPLLVPFTPLIIKGT